MKGRERKEEEGKAKQLRTKCRTEVRTREQEAGAKGEAGEGRRDISHWLGTAIYRIERHQFSKKSKTLNHIRVKTMLLYRNIRPHLLPPHSDSLIFFIFIYFIFRRCDSPFLGPLTFFPIQ